MITALAAWQHRLRRQPILLLALPLLAAVGASNAAAASPPGISAIHVTLHEPSGTELARARLELSAAGLRVRQQGADGRMEVVRDFAAERLWLVDRERAVTHEVAPEGVPDTIGNASDGSANAAHADAGLMATTPCAERERHREGQGRWRGQSIELWRCLDAQGETESVEMFSLEWRLVVRVSAPDGRVEELRDIRARDYAPGHFHPAARLREVDKLEFFFGAPEIGLFDERAASSPAAEAARP